MEGLDKGGQGPTSGCCAIKKKMKTKKKKKKKKSPSLEGANYISFSEILQHFIEPAVSLPCTKEPSTGPNSEPDLFSPF
jgi:hypothetical protein